MSSSSNASSAARRAAEGLAAAERPAHAVLFYGTEGAGQERYAMALAGAWLGGEFGDLFASAARPTSVDFQHIVPGGPSRLIRQGAIVGGEGQDDATVPLRQFFRTRPLGAPAKVVVIQDADRMVIPAANALLKTLEEPPAYARLILTTSAIGRVLPTIVSRCLSVACELPAELGEISEAERIFGERSPGIMERVRQNRQTYEDLLALLESTPGLPPVAALKLSESLRTMAERLEKALGDGTRSANAEVLRALALWLGERCPEWPDLRASAIEAHRRIVGNANAGLQFDAICAAILTRGGTS